MNKSQIKKALTETESRLEKAHRDLAKAQEKVRTLTQRIPELQQAVNSLRVLVGDKPPKLKKANVKLVDMRIDPKTFAQVDALSKAAERLTGAQLTPEQALKFAVPRDLSGCGSIPYNKDIPPSTEPEELPEVEGEEILD